MAVPDNSLKEYLHRAYVQAVAAQAGFQCDFLGDDWGVDARISEVRHYEDGTYQANGMHFNVQLKATQNYNQGEEVTKYELDAKAHTRLVRHDQAPIVLVVFCIPREPQERFLMDEDGLTLYRCCYWYPRPDKLTENNRSVTIDLPRANLFDPEACKSLMERAKAREL